MMVMDGFNQRCYIGLIMTPIQINGQIPDVILFNEIDGGKQKINYTIVPFIFGNRWITDQWLLFDVT